MLHQDHHNKISAGAARQLCYVLLGLMLLVLGCASGTTKKSSSLKSAKNVKSSVAELSSRNQSLLGLYSAGDEEVHMSNLRFDVNDNFARVKLDPLRGVRDRRQRFLAESLCPFEATKIHMKSLPCRRSCSFVAVIHLVLREALNGIMWPQLF